MRRAINVHDCAGIALYEALSVAIHYEIPFELPIKLFDDMKRTGFMFVEPSPVELKQAERIATTKAKGSGFPQLEDSIYHAMAIVRGGTFLTADRKHLERTRGFGGACLLSQWAPA
ncbi:VapC toxin family PIN domain ribonuclease [Mesorhizobium sp. CAU 1732]|uniref:VapC toxin family PIN domain ribonuclease n=1 Tax=Mesorhizobium sp. CAU 1732 TaxID=3140358 RepID=UPI00326061DA